MLGAKPPRRLGPTSLSICAALDFKGRTALYLFGDGTGMPSNLGEWNSKA
jgi:hypothetical protein